MGDGTRFYTLLGECGVSMFFMITSFLFRSRLTKQKERIDWFSLYVGRIFRIGPLYLLAAFCALVVAFLKVSFALNVTALKLLEEIGHWLALGYLDLTPVNGYSDAPLVLARVTWTLHYEWLLYASLLVLTVRRGGQNYILRQRAAAEPGLFGDTFWRSCGMPLPSSFRHVLRLADTGGNSRKDIEHNDVNDRRTSHWSRVPLVFHRLRGRAGHPAGWSILFRCFRPNAIRLVDKPARPPNGQHQLWHISASRAQLWRGVHVSPRPRALRSVHRSATGSSSCYAQCCWSRQQPFSTF